MFNLPKYKVYNEHKTAAPDVIILKRTCYKYK